MSIPRIRMVAGPNGSGKSTLIKWLHSNFSFPFGYEIHADEIQLELERSGKLDLGQWDLRPDRSKLERFLAIHPLASQDHSSISVGNDAIFLTGSTRVGYLAAMLSDFLRRELLARHRSFTFETVMSGADKIDLLREARLTGYRTYLYYVCTNDATINRERVASRVSQGGHTVPIEKIHARYERSLALLPEAIRLCDRAYVFDNSSASNALIAEFNAGMQVSMANPPPSWFVRAWLNKQS